MDAKFSIKMYDLENECHSEENCLYFRYVKELYTPYVYFEARFISSVSDVRKYGRIEFLIYTKIMHVGIIDSIDIKQKNNKYIVTVKSKGFTSLLCQNEPTPGILRDINLSGLISMCPDIPYISSETTENSDYIYVKDGSTVWDAICNLCYAQKKSYPYIYGYNTVRISKKSPSREITLTENTILETGVTHDSTRIISDIHMQDTDGNYDIYSKKNESAVQRNIVRHKQIPLDYQYLSNPDGALDYRFAYSMRGCICRYVKYIGFHYEDMFDVINYRNMKNQRVHKVELIFNGINYITTIGTYTDGFF